MSQRIQRTMAKHHNVRALDDTARIPYAVRFTGREIRIDFRHPSFPLTRTFLAPSSKPPFDC